MGARFGGATPSGGRGGSRTEDVPERHGEARELRAFQRGGAIVARSHSVPLAVVPVHDDEAVLGIDDPVLADPEALVELPLQILIAVEGGRRENLDEDVGKAFDRADT